MTNNPIRLGILGLGRAFTLMVPTFKEETRLRLVAATDSRKTALEQFEQDFGGRAHASAEALCTDPNVEAVYVATPHQVHADHVCLALSHGKHVLVEKPMAITLDECTRMIQAAKDHGAHLIVGHSHSFNSPVLHARALIEDGVYGQVRMITAVNYTDFLYRPRRPEELQTEQGGGVVFSQAAHQIDIVRLLAGGLVKQVRAVTGSWDPTRPTEGAYSALLLFENGAFATTVYSGYGHYDTDELQDNIGEMGHPKAADAYGRARRRLLQSTSAEDEARLKAEANYGGSQYAGPPAPAPYHQHFGHIVVSCDRADLRITPAGVMVYADTEKFLETIPTPRIPRAEVIDELWESVREGRTPVHNGQWSRATVEVCLAVLESARTGQDVTLHHQVSAEPVLRSYSQPVSSAV